MTADSCGSTGPAAAALVSQLSPRYANGGEG